ncbi:MAG: hypothetical protein KC422_16590 [Trueperaceae bacterium]|nr:hypothetical protein [Trueperaceae bacterium]
MRKRPSTLRSLLSLLIGGVVVTLILFATADGLCRYDISRRLPYYPNAELVSAQSDSFRLRALGNTEMIFSTSDTEEEVRTWYRNLNIEQLNKGILRGLADIQRTIRVSEDGDTIILYYSSCGL